MKCPKCNAEIDENETICSNCGEIIESQSKEKSPTIQDPNVLLLKTNVPLSNTALKIVFGITVIGLVICTAHDLIPEDLDIRLKGKAAIIGWVRNIPEWIGYILEYIGEIVLLFSLKRAMSKLKNNFSILFVLLIVSICVNAIYSILSIEVESFGISLLIDLLVGIPYLILILILGIKIKKAYKHEIFKLGKAMHKCAFNNLFLFILIYVLAFMTENEKVLFWEGFVYVSISAIIWYVYYKNLMEVQLHAENISQKIYVDSETKPTANFTAAEEKNLHEESTVAANDGQQTFKQNTNISRSKDIKKKVIIIVSTILALVVIGVVIWFFSAGTNTSTNANSNVENNYCKQSSNNCEQNTSFQSKEEKVVENTHTDYREEDIKNSINGHEYVDLGLSSGTLWATCNVGADSPEDFGSYFSWGETYMKGVYNNETYSYHDEPMKLPISVDAAADWGEPWRMPTKDDFDELIKNCQWKWSSYNGQKGYVIVGSNGESIFLPAAGNRLNDKSDFKDSYCLYWASTCISDKKAWYCESCSDYFDMRQGNRYLGLTIRPVCTTKAN